MSELVLSETTNMTRNDYVLEDLMNMCRLCLSTTSLVSIFDDRLESKENMKEIVEVTTGVQISQDDEISHMLCTKCFHLTIRMFRFRNTSMLNDMELKEKASDKRNMHKSVRDLLNQEPKLNIPGSLLRCDISPVVLLNRIVDIKVQEVNTKKYRNKNLKMIATNDDIVVENAPKKFKSTVEYEPPSVAEIIQEPPEHLEDPVFQFDMEESTQANSNTPISGQAEAKLGQDKELPLFTIKTTSKSVYICDVCNKVHYSTRDLKKHRATHMRCNLCRTKFSSMEETKEHETHCTIKNIMTNQPKLHIKRCDEIKEVREEYSSAFRNFVIIEISDDEDEPNSETLKVSVMEIDPKCENVSEVLKESTESQNIGKPDKLIELKESHSLDTFNRKDSNNSKDISIPTSNTKSTKSSLIGISRRKSTCNKAVEGKPKSSHPNYGIREKILPEMRSEDSNSSEIPEKNSISQRSESISHFSNYNGFITKDSGIANSEGVRPETSEGKLSPIEKLCHPDSFVECNPKHPTENFQLDEVNSNNFEESNKITPDAAEEATNPVKRNVDKSSEKKHTDIPGRVTNLENSCVETSPVKEPEVTKKKSNHGSIPGIPHLEKQNVPDNVDKSEEVPDNSEPKTKENVPNPSNQNLNVKISTVYSSTECEKPSNTENFDVNKSSEIEESQTPEEIHASDKVTDEKADYVKRSVAPEEKIDLVIPEILLKILNQEIEVSGMSNEKCGTNSVPGNCDIESIAVPDPEKNACEPESKNNYEEHNEMANPDLGGILISNKSDESPYQKSPDESVERTEPFVDSVEVNKPANRKLKRRKSTIEAHSQCSKKPKTDKAADEEKTIKPPIKNDKIIDLTMENKNKTRPTDHCFKPRIKFANDLLEVGETANDVIYLDNLRKRIKTRKSHKDSAVQTSSPCNSEIVCLNTGGFLYELKNLRSYLTFCQIPVTISHAKIPSIKYNNEPSSLMRSQEKLKGSKYGNSFSSGGNDSNIIVCCKEKEQNTEIESGINTEGGKDSSNVQFSTNRSESVATSPPETIGPNTNEKTDKYNQLKDGRPHISSNDTEPSKMNHQTDNSHQTSTDSLKSGNNPNNNSIQPDRISGSTTLSNQASNLFNVSSTFSTTPSSSVGSMGNLNKMLTPQILNMTNPILSTNAAIPYISYSIENIPVQQTINPPRQFYLVKSSNSSGIESAPMTMISSAPVLSNNIEAFYTSNVLTYGNDNSSLNNSLQNHAFSQQVSPNPVISSDVFSTTSLPRYCNSSYSSANMPSPNSELLRQVSSSARLPPPMRPIRFKKPSRSILHVSQAGTSLTQTRGATESRLANAPSTTQSIKTHVISNQSSTAKDVSQKNPNPVFIAPQVPPLNRMAPTLPKIRIIKKKNSDTENSTGFVYSATTKDSSTCDKLQQIEYRDGGSIQSEQNKSPVSGALTTKYIRVKNLAELR